MNPTVNPQNVTTQPPSTTECAYAPLLDEIRSLKADNLALAVASTLHHHNLDPSCIQELAPRLYDVLLNG